MSFPILGEPKDVSPASSDYTYDDRKSDGSISLDGPNEAQIRALHIQGKDIGYYDHNLDYTKEEEAKVIRKLDTRLFTAILLSTFVLNVDRTNISNAISAGLPADLGFTTNTVNSANQVYAVLFTIATVAGAVIGKRVGPHRFIPALMFAWGLVTLSHALLKNKAGYYAVRSFIALTEGGVIPATLVYLSYFYKSNELSTRLSWFWGIQSIASAVSGLMAAGLLELNHVRGLEGWKWLFIVDGIFTLLVAVFLWFYLPPSAAQGSLRFDDRQVAIAVTRTIRDDPSKVEYLTTQVTRQDVKELLTEYPFWGHLAITFIGLTPLTPYQTYLPSIIKGFKYNVFVANALTAPVYILQCISMVLVGWHSDRTGERGFHGLIGAIWWWTGFMLLRLVPANAGKGAHYVAALVTGSWPMTHPLNIAWMQENVAGVGKRTLANGMIIGAANIYAVWASQIYRAKDAPAYHTGNTICIAFASAAILLWIHQRYYYKHLNGKRVDRYRELSEQEKAGVQQNLHEEGSKSLLFKHTL